MKNDAEMIKRREALLRLGGLCGLGALAAGLVLRSARCGRRSPCAGWPEFAGCGLPMARQERNAKPGGES